jgi:hypothetical protein
MKALYARYWNYEVNLENIRCDSTKNVTLELTLIKFACEGPILKLTA